MRDVLATPEGRAFYRQRQVTIEPVFGQIKFNRAIKRCQRRGRTAVRSEWRLIAATHTSSSSTTTASRAGRPAPSRGAGAPR